MRLTPSILENSIRYITIFVGHHKSGKKKKEKERMSASIDYRSRNGTHQRITHAPNNVHERSARL